ncbi:protein mono-ADP-ribosyltransferase PARP12-like isoform X2 [Physella acuta]|uniref:protein mono-ADP-ribosyltransferase PARP12-like isoform X2 n=1 Tax=Physella acuta TaxID=109671 RepID=UPI0027DBC8E8|nr:protein mono-ADP-ribosyltransferase PARP12-like isoform X2 [Physella acuta]
MSRKQSYNGSTLNISHVVKLVNNAAEGFMHLDGILSSLGLFSSRNKLWCTLKDCSRNFILEDPLKDPLCLNGQETVWVRTTLSLCEKHCRSGKNGRSRVCEGRCESLHLCRTFLLQSESDCPFSSGKRKCMFGHAFNSEHNFLLLKKHNLEALDECELRTLFRRRASRNHMTLPQICIYYNRNNGSNCSNEKCKSLHLCSDFVENKCLKYCQKNHQLANKRVKHILNLFSIDKSWSEETILQELRKYLRPNITDDEEDTSSSSEDNDREQQFAMHGNHSASNHPCDGCKSLRCQLEEMKTEIGNMAAEIKKLKVLFKPLSQHPNTTGM